MTGVLYSPPDSRADIALDHGMMFGESGGGIQRVTFGGNFGTFNSSSDVYLTNIES